MTDRTALKEDFIGQQGWAGSDICPVAGDASFRRYDRLSRGDATAILMDAPPAFEDVRPFVAISRYLCDLGLSAPQILAADMENGFLLLEDLGDDLFARVIEKDFGREESLYEKAVSLLAFLQDRPVPEQLMVTRDELYRVPAYDMKVLLDEVALFVDWYLPLLTNRRLEAEERQEFINLWSCVLEDISQSRDCIVLRDYHAENLLHLPDRFDDRQVGLLDFQDALMGHRAYDLVSLLQDARRDVGPELELKMLNDYVELTGLEPAEFLRDYALLGAQRNAKIIGIFARLCQRDGKDKYLSLIPRVWDLLQRDLDHPALRELKDWFDRKVPGNLRMKAPAAKPQAAARAMILAAGLGTRMRPLTDETPKPLLKVAGKSMLDRLLDGLAAAGVRTAVVNMHYLADQIEAAVKVRPDHRPKVILSDERDHLMDSGGGVMKALPWFGNRSFYVLNSDLVWQENTAPGCESMLHRLAANWRPEDMDILMLLMPTDKAVGYDGAGDFHRDDSGRLMPRRASANPKASADYMYAGVLTMKPILFDGLANAPFSLREIFDRAAAAGRLYGIVHDGDWYHVGTPEALEECNKALTGPGDT
ncbi:phosphotransferase [Emcibacter sp.]|uniref:phosphotransferase n=1 Tax=Emcibacter sp. TaxID=1979954 RepID=UPI002AA70A27|nr:phosphotransferase [Emcibacter sp.]